MNDKRFTRIKSITFSKKPISLSANYRPIYKISQISLILKISSRSSKATLLKLHLFSWILNSSIHMEQVLEYINNGFNGKLSFWRIDPLVNRALDFGIAENFFIYKKGKYILALKGENLANKIISDEDIFLKEKLFLNEIGKKISESKVNCMLDEWKGVK